MGSISISVDTSVDAGLGGTGLAPSAHGRKLAAKITRRAATTTNKPRASMAPKKIERRSWFSTEFYAERVYISLSVSLTGKQLVFLLSGSEMVCW
jgi:hypothetical protein